MALSAFAGTPKTWADTASSTVVRFTVTNPVTGKLGWTRRITFKNTGASNDLTVYLPNNSVPMTIAPRSEQTVLDPITWFALASTSGTTYEVVASVS